MSFSDTEPCRASDRVHITPTTYRILRIANSLQHLELSMRAPEGPQKGYTTPICCAVKTGSCNTIYLARRSTCTAMLTAPTLAFVQARRMQDRRGAYLCSFLVKRRAALI